MPGAGPQVLVHDDPQAQVDGHLGPQDMDEVLVPPRRAVEGAAQMVLSVGFAYDAQVWRKASPGTGPTGSTAASSPRASGPT